LYFAFAVAVVLAIASEVDLGFSPGNQQGTKKGL
jgi:hypothetical protein